MSKVALSGADLSKIRGKSSIPSLEMYITPLESIVSGLITAVPTKYPTVSLTVTWGGATTDVAIGQYYQILSAGIVIANGIIRKAVSGSTCYINETPLGSFGFAGNIETAITAGMSIVIYSHHAMFSLNSRIDMASKTFYKYWDLAYSDQNEGGMPVANTGAWQCATLEAGESAARFTLPRSGSASSWSIGNTGFIGDGSVTWTLPSGVTLVAGYNDDDAVIEVDAEAGAHLISLEVTVSGNSHTAYCWLFVSNGSTYAGLHESLAIEISGDNQTILGRELELTVTGSGLSSTLYNGAAILFKVNSSYNGTSLSNGAEIDTFIGYITELNVSHDGNIGTATFKLVSPMILAAQINQPSQSLTQASSGLNWNKCLAAFANVRGFAYYLIRWTCPALMAMHDLDIPDDFEDTRRKYLEVNNKNLGANLQTVADYLLANIGSASDGTTVMRRIPVYLSNDDRNAIESIWTILDTDIKAPLAFFKRIYNAISDVRGGAFIFGGSGKPKAAYAGRRWSQGAGSSEMPNFIVTPTEGETRIKQVLGHYMAEQNAALQEIAVDFTFNQDVIDPAYLCWYQLTVSADYNPLGGAIDERLFATEISREWEFDGSIKKRIRLIGQIETFGQAGEILPIGNAKGLSLGGWSIGTPQFWVPNASGGMFGGASIVLALNEDGEFAVSFNYLAPEPDWSQLNASVLGLVVSDFDFDYASPYFASGGNAENALGVYAVTLNGTSAQIWYFGDILRSNAAINIQSYTLSDSTSINNARIKSSETYPALAIALFKDATGIRHGRSTDSGVSWGSLTRVGSAISDVGSNDNAPIGLAVFGQYQFVTAPDATPEYGTYRATTAAGAFTKMTGSEDSIKPIPFIAEAIESNDYIYASNTEADAYLNDFDASDYFVYGGTVLGSVAVPTYFMSPSVFESWNHSIVSGGVSGDCMLLQCTAPSGIFANHSVSLIFRLASLGSNQVVTDVEFDVKFDSPTSSKDLLLTPASDIPGVIGVSGQNEWQHVVVSRDLANWSGSSVSSGTNVNIFSLIARINGSDTANINIYFDNIVIYWGDGQKLWRVTDATGSPSWTDISPATNRAPAQPFALNVNQVDNMRLQLFSQAGFDWYSSDNSGTGWTLEDASSLNQTFYGVGDNLLIGGNEVISISFDNGATEASIEGNLDNLFDGLGTIKKLLAL